MWRSRIKKSIAIVLGGVIAWTAFWYFEPDVPLPRGKSINRIVVYKSKNIMEVYSGNELLKTYKVSLGRNPSGDKEKEGDKRTPEGDYFINGKNPNSGYHKNLGVSYPDKEDVREAKSKGFVPGGDIKIHGMKNGFGGIGKFHRFFNWTAGCVAVTDNEMDEIYDRVEIGTPITILP